MIDSFIYIYIYMKHKDENLYILHELVDSIINIFGHIRVVYSIKVIKR